LFDRSFEEVEYVRRYRRVVVRSNQRAVIFEEAKKRLLEGAGYGLS
jgi:hypothetical protein